MNRVSTENHTENTSSSEMTHRQKYRGLLKRSVLKNFRDNLFRYFDYIYTMASSHRYVSDVFRIIIFIQLLVLALFPFDKVLWPNDSLLGRILAVFSVISFICPTSVSPFSHFVVVLVIYVFLLLFYVLFFSNLYIFLKMSKVHSMIVSIISIFLNVLQPYFINMISSHLGRDLYYIIQDQDRIPHIFTLIFGVIFLVLLVVFQTLFVSPSITFRPQVIHIMYSRFSTLYNCCYILIFFLTTFGGLWDGLTGLILSYITIVPAALIVYISFQQSLWAYIPSMYTTQAFSIVFCCFAIILPTLSLQQIEGNEIVILCFIAVFTILIGVFQKLADTSMKKSLTLLNDISQDESLLEGVSYTKMLGLLRYGFDNGHPMCHTWKLFDLALVKHPNDYRVVLMYARYAAIYSEESTALQLITRSLKQIKHGSVELKHVLFQVNSLLQHRERGLSKSLKKTLSKIQDKTEKCRGQMRYTWECVIRGNVAELENLSTQLKRNEDEILREYNQLCLVYPNNPYVASAYSAFLLDIMCNEKEASEIQKVYRMLRSGARTRTERSYYFAIRHISTLPTEEQHALMTRTEKPAVNENHSYASSVAAVGMIGDLTDAQSEAKTQKRYIESMVNSVKLPTTRYGPILIIFSIALLMPILIIPELVVIILKMETNEKSLNIIKSVSLVNLYMAHTTFYSFQYAMSSNGYCDTMHDKYYKYVYDPGKVPEFENRKPKFYLDDDQIALLDTVENLRAVLNDLNNEIPDLATTGYFDEPLNYIFSDKMVARSYTDSENYSILPVSIEHIVTYTAATAIQTATLANMSAVYDMSGFWSIIKNAPIFFMQYDQFERIMTKSMQDMLNGSAKYAETIVLSVLIPGFVISLVLITFLTTKMEKEKHQLFRSFKALPKSAVSAIVQQLNAQSGKDNQESDHVTATGNAQEENALRVLSTSVDHGFGWVGRSWTIIVILIIFSAASIVGIALMNIIPKDNCNDLIMLTPLYHDISTIHTQYMVTTIVMNRDGILYDYTIEGESGTNFPHLKYPDNYSENWNIANDNLLTVMDNAHVLRFGDEATHSKGISIVGESLISLLSDHEETALVIPEEDIQVLELCSYDTSLEFINRMMNSMLVNMAIDATSDGGQALYAYYDTGGKKYRLIGVWLMDTSYTDYVIPSFAALDAAIASRSSKARNSTLLIPMIIVIIVIIACGIVLVPIYQRIGETAQWTLRLLLFCDPSVVLQSKVILKILSNDFSGNDNDESEEKSNFYESVVSHLLDGVIFMSNDLIIRSANNSVTGVIGKDPHDIVGMSLKDLFQSPQGQEASLRTFYQAVDGAMNCMRSPSIEAEVEVVKDNEPVTLLLSLTAISATGEVQLKPVNSEGLAILVLSMKDMTSTIVARTLLQEENAKNENLLSMILPPVIVKQLQRGEHSICFSVQSASIVFMDIVSFTPWCGSHPAAYIMATLNRLFLEFDGIIKTYDKMTKIKCIGDCYMCAGGIFDEVNQPAEHAKQAISFGLDAIRMIETLNAELNESLRIRVGCNTGGPIVAGVLGIEKPTFDILGPDINLAAMMEHHGVPMNVHIPQHVYELVYGDYFVIKERGDVDVKGKMYHTYIVSGYGHPNH